LDVIKIALKAPVSRVEDARPQVRGVAYLPALDGMRGVAAYIVLVYHVVLFFSLSWGPLAQSWFAPHSYLVVDAFYVMSGFVMAHAFDAKLAAGMSFTDFALHRFLRLYPMILAGVVLGAVSLVGYWALTPGVPLLAVAKAIGAGLFLMPTDALSAFKPYDFPVNSPFWSLSYEVVLCIGFGATYRYLKGWALVAALVVAAPAVCYVAWLKGGLDIGFRIGEYGLAFGRVVYPFLMGVFLRRLPAYRPQSHLAGYIAIPLLVVLVVNPLPTSALYDSVAVLVVIPVLVWMAATGRNLATADRFASASGALSYPLYALHFPIVVSLSNIAKKLALNGWQTVALALACIALSLGTAIVVYQVYDKPARAWLKLRLPFSKRSWA
jgi:peptidoglycan/LPS O-acetylase OafA/YrhL